MYMELNLRQNSTHNSQNLKRMAEGHIEMIYTQFRASRKLGVLVTNP